MKLTVQGLSFSKVLKERTVRSILACGLAFTGLAVFATSAEAGTCDGLAGQPRGLCMAAVQMGCETEPSSQGCVAISANWAIHCKTCTTDTPPWEGPAISEGCQELNNFSYTQVNPINWEEHLFVTLNVGETVHAEVTAKGVNPLDTGWIIVEGQGPSVNEYRYVDLYDDGVVETRSIDFTVVEDAQHYLQLAVSDGEVLHAAITCTAD